MSATIASGRRLPFWAPIATVLVGTTVAGLLYLHLASQIETSGRKIVALEERRAELLQARAAALRTLADATSPARLETRAKSLGFRSDTPFDTVPVPNLAWADTLKRADAAGLTLAGESVFSMAMPPAGGELVSAWAALAGDRTTTASAGAVGGAQGLP